MDFITENWPEITAIVTAGLAFVLALLSYIAPKTRNTYDDKVLEVLTAIKDFVYKTKEDEKE